MLPPHFEALIDDFVFDVLVGVVDHLWTEMDEVFYPDK